MPTLKNWPLVQPDEFRQFGEGKWMFKYVRFADGHVMFCNGCDANTDHRSIVYAHNDMEKGMSRGDPLPEARQ